MKVRLRATALLDVEAREPHHDRGDEDEAKEPRPPFAVEDREIHDHGWRNPEADGVDQRVELRAEAATRSRRARNTAVESVHDTAKDDVEPGLAIAASRRSDDCPHPKEEISEREAVRQQHDGAAHVGAGESGQRWHQAGNSASTVTPATGKSPSLVRSFELGGTKTSTREPNRMMPIRIPCSTSCPAL